MATVVFLRGVNVGGHRTFRPSELVRQLPEYDIVNIGAAGTFVVRKPVAQTTLRTALLKKLSFKTEVVLCTGAEFSRAATQSPFDTQKTRADVVRFLTILSKKTRVAPSMPVAIPPEGEWFVRLVAVRGRFVYGEYRRHMKTVGYLGKVDKLFDVPVTTRNWNTVAAIMKILSSKEPRRGSRDDSA